MKILITGSSGTIGTRLFETLLPQHQVTGVDIRSNGWLDELNTRAIIVDLRNRDELIIIPTDFDMIIHLAANARVYELVKNPRLSLDNIVMSFNVLDYMRENGIKKKNHL